MKWSKRLYVLTHDSKGTISQVSSLFIFNGRPKKKKKLCLKIHVHVFMKKVKTGCKMLKTPKNLSITAACLFPSHLSFLKIRSYIITKYN